jgi:hypothetical protein
MKRMAKIDRKRKYFLIVMVFLLIAGAVYRIWPQIVNISAGESDVALKKKQLIKYRKVLWSARGLEKELSLLKVTLKKGEVGLLTGKTPALAAADIQKVVQKVAQKSQVEIRSVRVLKPKEVGGSYYLSIPVEMTIRGATKQLKEFFYQIVGSSKYLTIRAVKITVTLQRRRGDSLPRPSIQARITINGFLKNSDEPAK